MVQLRSGRFTGNAAKVSRVEQKREVIASQQRSHAMDQQRVAQNRRMMKWIEATGKNEDDYNAMRMAKFRARAKR